MTRPNPGFAAAEAVAAKPQVIPMTAAPPEATFLPGRAARRRRMLVKASFALLVVLPWMAAVAYLFGMAADQFRSETSFSVRSEETGSMAAGILGAITQVGSGSASDTDVLYDFIRSRRMADAVDQRLDLRAVWGKAPGDPVFGLAKGATGDDLADYWNRMVMVTKDGQAGILRVSADAFAAADAQAITEAVIAESGALVNRLSEQARRDAIRFSQADLAEAEGRLKAMRLKLSEFRRTYRIVDPKADVEGQMGLLSALQGELAQGLVERDTILSYADESDHRVTQVNRRIEAIQKRIEAERSSLGLGTSTSPATDVLGDYEALLTDMEFAQAAYTQALTNETVARAESRRQARYLAAHVAPTRPDTAQYPRRWLLSGLTAVFLVLGWSVLVVFYYNVRDNS